MEEDVFSSVLPHRGMYFTFKGENNNMSKPNLKSEKENSFPLAEELPLEIAVTLFSDAGVSSSPRNTITIIHLVLKLKDGLHPLLDLGYGTPEDYDLICTNVRDGKYTLCPHDNGLSIVLPNITVKEPR